MILGIEVFRLRSFGTVEVLTISCFRYAGKWFLDMPRGTLNPKCDYGTSPGMSEL